MDTKSGKDRKDKESPQETSKIVQEEDGRDKEWQDRSRVNLEIVKEGTKTNIERDFEREEEEGQKDEPKNDQSVY